MLAGCAAADKKIAVTPLDLPAAVDKKTAVTPVDPPAAVVFAPDAWIRGVTHEDIDYIKSALAQVRGAYQVKHPIISLGKSSVPGGESMIAYTILYYYDFEQPTGGRWALVRCGSYNAD